MFVILPDSNIFLPYGMGAKLRLCMIFFMNRAACFMAALFLLGRIERTIKRLKMCSDYKKIIKNQLFLEKVKE